MAKIKMKMAPLLLLSLSIIHGVNAAWYSELCHAGPRYKVRVDPITGKVVPVYPELPSSFATEQEPDRKEDDHDNDNINNSNTIDGLSDIFPTEIINDNPVEATFIGAEFDTEPTESGVEDENENETEDDTISTTPPFNFRRVLRSNRLWRDFDEDSETEALVMDRNNNLQNNMNNMNMNNNMNNVPSSMSASFFRRFLGTYYEDVDEDDDDAATATTVTVTATNTRMDQDQNQRFLEHASREEEELKAGEFYVRPCLCSESRWTFAEGLGYNATTNTILTEPAIEIEIETEAEAGAEADGSQPKNTVTIPNNIGLAANGQYVTVDTNYPNGDLYLCNVQTVYCGIFDDTDTNSISIVGNSNSNSNSNGNSNTFDIDSYYDQKSLNNVKCYDQNVRHIIAKNAWPLILLWYFGLAVICCCTVHGRTAGDYVQDRLTQCGKRLFCGLCGCCCGCFRKYDFDFDFNNRMLNRMVRDDNRERRRLRSSSISSSDDDNETSGDNNESNNNDNDNDDNEDTHFWCYSSQRRQFERSLMAQVQWIWRHQEYLREVALREQGLPPPHLKLKVKRFRMETSTSVSREGGFTNSNDLDSTTSVATTATTTTATTSKAGESNSNDKNNNEKGDNDDDDDDDDDNDNDNDNDEFVTLDFGPNMEDGDGDGDEAPPTEHNNENEIDNDDLDSLDAPTCTICFCPFEEGDRIGDLTCKHEFHVDCLKGWVQRKNSCPLCNVRLGKPERQAAAVAAAEALLDETAATTTSNTNNSNSNINSNSNSNNMNSNINSNSSSTDSTSRRSLGSRIAYFIWRRETGSVSTADGNIESRR